MRGETRCLEVQGAPELISIRSPHARGDLFNARQHRRRQISIHSPHTRGDFFALSSAFSAKISIHSPHTRGDKQEDGILTWEITFQSTPLIRGETTLAERSASTSQFQSTPLIRGETWRSSAAAWPCRHFNPLPSHEGRQHKPPKIHPNLRQLTQQNHDTPLFGALQAPFCGAEPDIRGAKPMGKP